VSTPPNTVVIREVGLRDGLQSIDRVLPTAHKIEWIRDAYAAGQREIEVGSFVPARLLPQLADTAELVAFAKTLPGLSVSVLVPNLKGALRALECAADLMLIPLSASHAHSLANLRKTPDDVVAEIARIRAARDASAAANRRRCCACCKPSSTREWTVSDSPTPSATLILQRSTISSSARCASQATD